MSEPQWITEVPLIREAGPLWEEATHSPFLDAAAAGSLPPEAFRRWLSQDYLFAKGLTAFQAIVLAKAPRECHRALISGLTALNTEMEWFEAHAARLALELEIPPHPVCRGYTDFLMRCAYTQPYPVLLVVLFGVEVSYLVAWSALEAKGAYAEFIERWSSAAFADYVATLRALAERYPHEAAQAHFNRVLEQERDFWRMAWEG
ncbi:MAG: TenA family transcriptional regulator [Acidobacteria bacterium]|nr:TenA family transcriptional regulator [Acidobacteriota bacterium]